MLSECDSTNTNILNIVQSFFFLILVSESIYTNLFFFSYVLNFCHLCCWQSTHILIKGSFCCRNSKPSAKQTFRLQTSSYELSDWMHVHGDTRPELFLDWAAVANQQCVCFPFILRVKTDCRAILGWASPATCGLTRGLEPRRADQFSS